MRPASSQRPSHAHARAHATGTDAEPPRPALVLLALFSVWVIWGSTYLAIRFALVSLPPFLMAGVRSLTAGTILYAFLRWRGAATPSPREWRNAAAIGVLMLTLANGAVVWAQGTIPSSLAALGVATTPLWVALALGFLEGWPRATEWVGLAIGFAGVFLLNGDGNLRTTPAAAGALLLAQLSWAGGAILNRRLRLPDGPMASAAQMIVGGSVLLVVSAAVGEAVPRAPAWSSLAALGYLIVFGSIIAFSSFNFLIRNVAPSLATSNAYVNPLVAVLLGVGFAGEKLSPATMVAMVVILTGVAIVLFAHGSRARR
jgi:drug/metabolite transporter (DMT)-like permease